MLSGAFFLYWTMCLKGQPDLCEERARPVPNELTCVYGAQAEIGEELKGRPGTWIIKRIECAREDQD